MCAEDEENQISLTDDLYSHLPGEARRPSFSISCENSFLCLVCIFGFQRYHLCLSQKNKHFFSPWTSVGVQWVFVFKLESVENALLNTF